MKEILGPNGQPAKPADPSTVRTISGIPAHPIAYTGPTPVIVQFFDPGMLDGRPTPRGDAILISEPVLVMLIPEPAASELAKHFGLQHMIAAGLTKGLRT